MPLGCVIYIPELYHAGSHWCTPMRVYAKVVDFWYSLGFIYMHSTWGFLKLLVSTTMGNSQEPLTVKRATVQGFTSFFCVFSRTFITKTSGCRSPSTVQDTDRGPMATSKQESSQIKSRKRVADHGEVFTAEREVNAMLDLVANECLRPDSRFLEPACGDGNFLAAILRRKLAELRRKYKKSPRDYEKLSIVAIGSLYGVDIMNDNVEACRQRLFRIWDEEYTAHCTSDASDEAREAARFIISRNIINGNALTLMCVDDEGRDTKAPIVFSEWTLINGTQMQRSDYTMADLLLHNDTSQESGMGNLFALTEEQKEEGGIFLRRYITHYKKVQDYGKQ